MVESLRIRPYLAGSSRVVVSTVLTNDSFDDSSIILGVFAAIKGQSPDKMIISSSFVMLKADYLAYGMYLFLIVHAA